MVSRERRLAALQPGFQVPPQRQPAVPLCRPPPRAAKGSHAGDPIPVPFLFNRITMFPSIFFPSRCFFPQNLPRNNVSLKFFSKPLLPFNQPFTKPLMNDEALKNLPPPPQPLTEGFVNFPLLRSPVLTLGWGLADQPTPQSLTAFTVVRQGGGGQTSIQYVSPIFYVSHTPQPKN